MSGFTVELVKIPPRPPGRWSAWDPANFLQIGERARVISVNARLRLIRVRFHGNQIEMWVAPEHIKALPQICRWPW